MVLWHPGLDPASVAGLAGTRTYPLNSSFQPSYNMAVNLVGQVGRQRAAVLLESSFAQFQADRGRGRPGPPGGRHAGGDAGAVGGLRARRHRPATPRSAASCPTASATRPGSGPPPGAARRWPRWSGCAAATSSRCPAAAGPGSRSCCEPTPPTASRMPLVLTANRQVKRLSPADFPVPVTAIERIRIPASFSVRSANHRRDLAATVRNKLAGRDLPRPRRSADGAGRHRRRGDRAAAPRAARAPMPPVPGPRGAPAPGRALHPAGARGRDAGAPGGQPVARAGPDLRPGLRGAGGAGLHRRRRGDPGGPAARPPVQRAGPGRRRVPAPVDLGRPDPARAGRLRVRAHLRGPPARRRRAAPAARRPGAAPCWPT